MGNTETTRAWSIGQDASVSIHAVDFDVNSSSDRPLEYVGKVEVGEETVYKCTIDDQGVITDVIAFPEVLPDYSACEKALRSLVAIDQAGHDQAEGVDTADQLLVAYKTLRSIRKI